jgi:hypothetical protein
MFSTEINSTNQRKTLINKIDTPSFTKYKAPLNSTGQQFITLTMIYTVNMSTKFA